MELETLLKEKQDVIASSAGSSVNPPQHSMSSSFATPHALVSTSASTNFDNFGAAGYIDPFVPNDSSSVFGVFEEGFVGGIPTELGNWPEFHLS